MIYKNKDINVNIKSEKVDIGNVQASFYTEDKGTSSIRIYINYKGATFDLTQTGFKPKLDLFLQDGSIFIDEPVDIIMPSNGLIQYKIRDEVIKHVGLVNAKLFLINNTDSIHIANFNFNILDSGINGKVQKEISVNLVEDSVRKIISESAMELLDENFKSEVSENLQNYVNDNSDKFKGPKGEKGDKGATGLQGEKGDRGYQGEQGPQGLIGERGPRGYDGERGIMGPEGPRGEVGPQGIQGLKGDSGKDASVDDVIIKLNDNNRKIKLDTYNLKVLLNTRVPLQSFIYTDEFVYGLRLEPAKTRAYEDITLMRFSLSGTLIDSMKLLGVGHIENAGYKDKWFYFVMYSSDGTSKKLVKFKYSKDFVLSYETADNTNLVSLNIDISSDPNKVNVNIFDDIINLMFYKGENDGISLKQFDINTLKQINNKTLVNDTPINWLQGCVASDQFLFVVIGDYTFGNYKQIRKYDISTNKLIEVKDISDIGADDVGNNPLNNWNEPEGLQILQTNGNNTLLSGAYTGGSNETATQKRFKIYEWNYNVPNRSDYLSFNNHSEAMIFEKSIQGNDLNQYKMSEVAKNYKFLTFYYTAGYAGTGTCTIPTDLLKIVKYVDLERKFISNNNELFTYIARVTFLDDLKSFSLTSSRSFVVNIGDSTKSASTKDNYAGFYLYKIKGHQMYNEFDL